jgi:hypothetical protein
MFIFEIEILLNHIKAIIVGEGKLNECWKYSNFNFTW